MTKKEKTLIADLLQISHQQFMNHGCNDLDKDVYCGWTDQEKEEFTKEYWEFIDPEEGGLLPLNDSMVMYFMEYKLIK